MPRFRPLPPETFVRQSSCLLVYPVGTTADESVLVIWKPELDPSKDVSNLMKRRASDAFKEWRVMVAMTAWLAGAGLVALGIYAMTRYPQQPHSFGEGLRITGIDLLIVVYLFGTAILAVAGGISLMLAVPRSREGHSRQVQDRLGRYLEEAVRVPSDPESVNIVKLLRKIHHAPALQAGWVPAMFSHEVHWLAWRSLEDDQGNNRRTREAAALLETIDAKLNAIHAKLATETMNEEREKGAALLAQLDAVRSFLER